MGKNYNNRNFEKDMEAPIEAENLVVESEPIEEAAPVEEKKVEAPAPKKEENKVATPKAAAKKVGGPARN